MSEPPPTWTRLYAENVRLREALDEALDCLREGGSGYIPGSGSDQQWLDWRDAILTKANSTPLP